MRRLALAVLLASGLVASAQSPDPAKKKIAKEYVDAGLAAQKAKDFDTAINLYAKAHDLIPHPVLLFNIAQAHRLAGREAQALSFYERYVAAEPRGTHASLARTMMADIKTKLLAEQAREDARLAEAARTADEARTAAAARQVQTEQDERARQVARASAEADAARARELSERQAARGRSGGALRVGGIVAAGIGATSLGASVYFGLRSRAISNELSAMGAQYIPERVRDGETAERNAIILGIGGAALIVAGGATYYLGRRQRERARDRGQSVSIVIDDSRFVVGIRGSLP
ncbi:MAG TPA: hypothetical protein VK427_14110 [Kofleriaceae bacterium]|nr:hypothetical protein [Kofleriaceae bacterium]